MENIQKELIAEKMNRFLPWLLLVAPFQRSVRMLPGLAEETHHAGIQKIRLTSENTITEDKNPIR